MKWDWEKSFPKRPSSFGAPCARAGHGRTGGPGDYDSPRLRIRLIKIRVVLITDAGDFWIWHLVICTLNTRHIVPGDWLEQRRKKTDLVPDPLPVTVACT